MARPTNLLLSIFLLQLLSSTITTTAADTPSSPNPFPTGPEKQTHLHYYFQDFLSGSSPSAIRVVNSPLATPFGFGTVMMTDDALTEKLDRSSAVLGRAQGFYAVASKSAAPSMLMTMNHVFTSGEFNGSSLALLGRNPVTENVRELAVVGGSGRFRMARGYALVSTRWFNASTGDASVEYNVYVVHH